MVFRCLHYGIGTLPPPTFPSCKKEERRSCALDDVYLFFFFPVVQKIIIQAQPQICATKQFIYQEFMGSWIGKKHINYHSSGIAPIDIPFN